MSTDKISKRHWSLKEQALALRANGLGYSEILKQIPVAKSTISLWCRNVVLTQTQKDRIKSNRGTSYLVGIKAIQKNFWFKRKAAFAIGLKKIRSLDKTSRFYIGLALYWAEGTKSGNLDLTNSDPRIISFMVSWLKEFWQIEPKSLVIQLHLHSGQNEQNMRQYWSRLTKVPLENFQKSFVKPEGSGYRKKKIYNGTVKLRVRKIGSTYLLFSVLGSIAGMLRYAVGEKPNPENWMEKLPYA